jgi:hypothetical protein
MVLIMKEDNHAKGLIPPALLAEIEAIAAVEHRPARDMVHEALERYLQEHQPLHSNVSAQLPPKRTPQEAAARMLERRKHHKLPEGTTIRDLMTFGRA